MSQICLPSTPSTRHKSHVPKTYSTRTSESATSHRGKLCQLIRSNDWLPLRHEGFCYFFVSSARQPASQTTNFPSFVRRVWSTFGKLQTAAFIKLTSVFFFLSVPCHLASIPIAAGRRRLWQCHRLVIRDLFAPEGVPVYHRSGSTSNQWQRRWLFFRFVEYLFFARQPTIHRNLLLPVGIRTSVPGLGRRNGKTLIKL